MGGLSSVGAKPVRPDPCGRLCLVLSPWTAYVEDKHTRAGWPSSARTRLGRRRCCVELRGHDALVMHAGGLIGGEPHNRWAHDSWVLQSGLNVVGGVLRDHPGPG